jgi:hypothetical protein
MRPFVVVHLFCNSLIRSCVAYGSVRLAAGVLQSIADIASTSRDPIIVPTVLNLMYTAGLLFLVLDVYLEIHRRVREEQDRHDRPDV